MAASESLHSLRPLYPLSSTRSHPNGRTGAALAVPAPLARNELAPLSQATAHMPLPRPLIPGERVELWLELPLNAAASPSATPEPEPATLASQEQLSTVDWDAGDADWDVRPARVAAITPEVIVLLAGGWQLTEAPGARAVVRRFGVDGLAEWEGEIGPQEVPTDLDFGVMAALHAAPDATVMVRVPSGGGAGHLYQRRRRPRVAVGLTPVRLTPVAQAAVPVPAVSPVTLVSSSSLAAPVSPAPSPSPSPDESLLPVARLTDLSETGAGVVVDFPLSPGTTVALEFHLPGDPAPFAVRGRVVEPAVPLHGESQPQLDGLPGFRRGVEFIGNTANREARRLAAALGRMLQPGHSGD